MDIHRLLNELADAQSEIAEIATQMQLVDNAARSPERPRIATDQSGAVTVELSPNNVPAHVTIDSRWTSLGVGRLDTAIMDAAASAYVKAWEDAADEVEHARRSRSPMAPEIGVDKDVPKPRNGRALPDLLNDVFDLSHGDTIDQTPQVATVSDRQQKVTVIVGRSGMVELTIDQSWAETSSSREVAELVNGVLRRVDDAGPLLEEQAKAQSEPVEDLFAELLGVITSLGNDKATPGER